MDTQSTSNTLDLTTLTPEQVAALRAAGVLPQLPPSTNAVTQVPADKVVPIRTPEAQARLAAAMPEDPETEDEDPVETLADLKARSKTWVTVYPAHPKRLKVAYLPSIAADPSVQAKALRLVNIAKKLQDFETAHPEATRRIMARIEAGEEVTEAEKQAAMEADNQAALDAMVNMDVDGFERLLLDLKSQMADYLVIVCPEWSLKDPPIGKDALLEAGLGIMQDIFTAVRRKDDAKNGSGSA